MKINELLAKELPKKGYCGQCDDFVSYHVESFKDQVHNVKGLEVISDEFIGICDKCGNHIWIDEVESANDIIVYNEYKKKMGLLTTYEIKAIRKKRGMSQRELAKFLCIGEKDIARYESGAIQTRAIDLMIRMVDDDETFASMSKVVNNLKVAYSGV